MLPSFLSHFSTSLEVFPGIPSQINYLHLNQHFKVSFWETPNQDAHPWFCLHLVATHPFTSSLLTFSENNHITKKFHFATNTENSKLKNQGLCFLDGRRNSKLQTAGLLRQSHHVNRDMGSFCPSTQSPITCPRHLVVPKWLNLLQDHLWVWGTRTRDGWVSGDSPRNFPKSAIPRLLLTSIWLEFRQHLTSKEIETVF